MYIEKIYECDIEKGLKLRIQKLLIESFPNEYPTDRIYFKQLPHLRFLAFDENKDIVAQVGLDYRIMNLNSRAIKVLGIIDLCVLNSHRSRGIASLLLSEVNKFAKKRDVDFLLLFADNMGVYLKNGFIPVKNRCKWMRIDDENQTTIDIGSRIFEQLMIKEVGNIRWMQGELDLLGYLY